MKKTFHLRKHLQLHQRGVSLIFALIALVALMFGALAVVRSVDSAGSLLGNLGFKQDATVASDQFTRQAIAWLSANSASLNKDITASGYYARSFEFASDGATRAAPLDLTGNSFKSDATRQMIDWDDNGCKAHHKDTWATCDIKTAPLPDINQNKGRFVIMRLCNKEGDYVQDSTVKCAKPLASGTAGATGRGDLSYSEPVRFGTNSATYFRILVRVQGFRNTTSFTETIVHF